MKTIYTYAPCRVCFGDIDVGTVFSTDTSGLFIKISQRLAVVIDPANVESPAEAGVSTPWPLDEQIFPIRALSIQVA